MKRVLVLGVLPLLVFALEKVNLIKDAGFEKDSEVWNTYTGASGTVDSAIVSYHSQEYASQGFFSAFCDTRGNPGGPTFSYDTAVVIQGFSVKKVVADIDSLSWGYAVFPLENNFFRLYCTYIGLYLNAGTSSYLMAIYGIKASDLTMTSSLRYKILDQYTFFQDTAWHLLAKHIKSDLGEAGISTDATVDSIVLLGGGLNYPPWRGQKVFFDAIRLTGYADYDVGVKGILSGDSVWAGVYYKPVARIKSFGRQAADDFLAIAEIYQESGADSGFLVWADTIPYTLPGDTEDTLTFDSFPIPNALSYTLTVRTEMYAPGAIDESDEDDALSKPLYGTGIAEPVTYPDDVILEVESFTANARVTYSLPPGQSGTLAIYDASGRRIESLEVQGSGEVEFSPQSSGVYFVRLEAAQSSIIKRTVVLR